MNISRILLISASVFAFTAISTYTFEAHAAKHEEKTTQETRSLCQIIECNGTVKEVEHALKSHKHDLKKYIDAKDDFGRSALMLSAEKGKEKIFDTLLQHGAGEYLHIDMFGQTALSYAAMHGTKHMLDKLIDKNTNINYKDGSGRTLLMKAAITGNEETVAELLNKGTGIDEIDKRTGMTALMYAAVAAKLNVLHILIKHGANAKLKDKDGKTAVDLVNEKLNGLNRVAEILKDIK